LQRAAQRLQHRHAQRVPQEDVDQQAEEGGGKDAVVVALLPPSSAAAPTPASSTLTTLVAARCAGQRHMAQARQQANRRGLDHLAVLDADAVFAFGADGAVGFSALATWWRSAGCAPTCSRWCGRFADRRDVGAHPVKSPFLQRFLTMPVHGVPDLIEATGRQTLRPACPGGARCSAARPSTLFAETADLVKYGFT
jgi:hypothetical protein